MEKYIEHLIGFAGMSEWMERWRRHASQVTIEENLIHLAPWISRRFLFGLPKRPVIGASPFMGAQPEELAWLSMMQWKRACLDVSSNRFYLVSSRLRGDDKAYPDLPAFAIGIHVEPVVASVLQRFRQVDVRQVWVDDGKVEITRHPSISTRMSIVSEPSQVLSGDDVVAGRSFEDLLSAAIHNTNRILPPGAGGRSNAVVG